MDSGSLLENDNFSIFLKASSHFRCMELILHPITHHQGPIEADSENTYALLSAATKAEIYNKWKLGVSSSGDS